MEQQTSDSKAASAPDPEDDRKPDAVTDLHTRSWKFIAKRTIRECGRRPAMSAPSAAR
jgi:membrane protein